MAQETNEFASWGLPPSVLKVFEEEEIDLKAALVLEEDVISRLIPKCGPRAKFISQRKLFIKEQTFPLPLPNVDASIVPSRSNTFEVPSRSNTFEVPSRSNTFEVPSRSNTFEVPSCSNTFEVPSCSNTLEVPSRSIEVEVLATEAERPAGSGDSGRPAKRQKICKEYINDVERILDSTIEGQLVLASFKKEGRLCNSSRDHLVRCIIFALFREDCNTVLTTSLLEQYSKAIVEVFPSESELQYFSRHKRNNKKVVGGRLIVKYHNLRRKLIAVGLIEKQSLEEELRVEEGIEFVSVDIEEDEDLRWLSANSRPWADVLSAWERTYITRMRLVKGLKSVKPVVEGDENLDDLITSVPKYLTYFRPLTSTHGWELLCQDFNQIHPGKGQSLAHAWPKLISFAKRRIPSKAAGFLDSQELSYDQKATELLGMFQQIFKIRNVSTPKGSWKVSRLEVQRSFVLHAETDAKWKSIVNDRQQALAEHGLTLQPYIVFIGPLNSIKTYRLVYCDKIWWDLDSPLQVLDVAFKAFFATDTSYPPESRHIWTFIQRSVYGIICPTDFSEDKPLKAFLSGDEKEFAALQV